MNHIQTLQVKPIFSGIWRLLAHLTTRRRWHLLGLFLLMLLGAASELATLGAVLPFLALLTDPKMISEYPILQDFFAFLGFGGSDNLLFLATALFAIATVFAAFVRIYLSWAIFKFVFAVGHDISVDVYKRNLFQSYSFHVTHNSSEVLSSIDKCNFVVFTVVLPFVQTLVSIILCIAILAALLKIDAFSAITAGVGFSVIYLSITFFTRRKLMVNSAAIAVTQTKRIQAVQEALGGIRDVIIDGTQRVYISRFLALDLSLREAQASNSFIGVTPRYLIEAIGMILIVGIAYWQAIKEGSLSSSLPVLGALVLGAQKLMPQMQQIYYGWASYMGNQASLYDVLSFLDRPIPFENSDSIPTNSVSYKSQIKLHDVSFSYQSNGVKVINKLNVIIPKGSRVGFVGVTGSGKSTVIDLIMGLLVPTKGSIEVDEVALTDENRRDWQRRVAHVPQVIYLSDASIAENIAFGQNAEDIDMTRVRDAAYKAQIAEDIESMRNGYSTFVGERGIRLSGGQRQRIGLARAFYKMADILILDEATSALDDATELAVMSSIARLGNSVTVIMIAHRLSTLASCDIIFDLKDGKLHRQGRFLELWPDKSNP